MTLSGYIFERYSDMKDAYTCRRLIEEARMQGIDISLIGINDCILQNGVVICAGRPLEKRDFAIIRYKWGKIKDDLAHLVKRTYNPLDAFRKYVNKFEQMTDLRSDGFDLPEYMLSTACVPFSELTTRLSVPFVAKGLESSMGHEIFLIKDESDYSNLRRIYSHDKEWLWEEFISSSKGHDLRLFSIRGEAISCMERVSTEDFRANVALGANVKPYTINKKLRQISKDIYQQTRLDFVGIDLLFGVDNYYLCEINVMPGLEGIESASGINIANQIVSLISNDFKNG